MHLDSEIPPAHIFLNYNVCETCSTEIAKILEDRIANGSLELLGRVGEVEPPHIVMPLIMVGNKDKMRLCHDERYLNLFMAHKPFSLEGLPQIPHMLYQGDYIANTDEKSAYDGVMLSERSRNSLAYNLPVGISNIKRCHLDGVYRLIYTKRLACKSPHIFADGGSLRCST